MSRVQWYFGRMGIPEAGAVSRALRVAATACACALLANCASSDKFARKVDPKYGVSASPRVVEFGEPVPKGGGTFRVGKPYTVAGRTYVPEDNANYRAEGLASWYGDDFHGRLTANGEIFDMTSLSAAHPTMPLPSYARVTNMANGKSVIVRVNDRGPYHGNRLIDVSHNAANLLGFRQNGIGRVRVEYVGRAPLEGSDDRQLLATLRTGEPAPAPSLVRVAAAGNFVPQVPASRSAAIRGDIPMPGGRPYTLGSDSQSLTELSASRSVRTAGQALDNPRTVSVASDGNLVAPQTRPVSAYAPVRQGDGIGSLLNGRGLY